MNLIEKMHALLVSDNIRIWQYHEKKEGPQFYCWDIAKDGSNINEEAFLELDHLIEDAYARIDPLNKPLPEKVKQ